MSMIDPTARIDPGAQIGSGVSIGPYSVIGANVVIGDGCALAAHVHVTGHTEIGARTRILPFASLGTSPQSTHYRGGPTRLVIGEDCDIREGVTMNTGTEDGGGITRIGDKCMFMVNSHVGHDCIVGSRVTFANGALLGGHVIVGDGVTFGGGCAVHQFTRIGEGAMISGMTGCAKDVIPFGFVGGHRGYLVGLNVVGLKRRGHTRADLHRVRHAYRDLFLGAGTLQERVKSVSVQHASDPIVGKIVAFISETGSRKLMTPTSTLDVDTNDADTSED